MEINSNVEKAGSKHDEREASEAKNVRPEPVSLRVRTAVKAGFSFVSKINKASPE